MKVRNLKQQFESEMDSIQSHVRETTDRQFEIQNKIKSLEKTMKDNLEDYNEPVSAALPSNRNSMSQVKMNFAQIVQKAQDDLQKNRQEETPSPIKGSNKSSIQDNSLQLNRYLSIKNSPPTMSKKEKQELIDVKLLEFEENFNLIEEHVQRMQSVSLFRYFNLTDRST